MAVNELQALKDLDSLFEVRRFDSSGFAVRRTKARGEARSYGTNIQSTALVSLPANHQDRIVVSASQEDQGMVEQPNSPVHELMIRQIISVSCHRVGESGNEERAFFEGSGLEGSKPFDPVWFEFESVLLIAHDQAGEYLMLLFNPKTRPVKSEATKVCGLGNLRGRVGLPKLFGHISR